MQSLWASRMLSKETCGLLYLPSIPKLTPSSVIRVIVAAGLALALLAGVIPFNTFSSAQQTCTMTCCAGKPPHLAGSCSMAFSDADQAETGGASGASEHQAHTGGAAEAGAMQMQEAAPEIIEATSHCGTTESSSEHKPSTRRTSHQTASIIAHVLTSPCSPECAAAAVPNFSQVRRPRADSAMLTAGSRPRPPTLVSPVEQTTQLQTSPEVFCRQSRPRAPPRLVLDHLPA